MKSALYPKESWYLFPPPTRRSDYSNDYEGKVRPIPRLEPCWSMLVIDSLSEMWADEPSRTWAQIWVQAGMPDYSLNWTTGPVLYKGVDNTARLPEGVPA